MKEKSAKLDDVALYSLQATMSFLVICDETVDEKYVKYDKKCMTLTILPAIKPLIFL